ncbi:hypothetical protein D3C84_722840 [compost metagenome]
MQPLINYFKMVLHPGPDTFRFALRTIVACLLTLYLAFLFDTNRNGRSWRCLSSVSRWAA